jgi:hypothetical protein
LQTNLLQIGQIFKRKPDLPLERRTIPLADGFGEHFSPGFLSEFTFASILFLFSGIEDNPDEKRIIPPHMLSVCFSPVRRLVSGKFPACSAVCFSKSLPKQ